MGLEMSDTDQECSCPGCFTLARVKVIQDQITAIASVEAIYNSGAPDPRFNQILTLVQALGQDVIDRVSNYFEKNQIGIPFVEGTPEFMDLFPGLKRPN